MKRRRLLLIALPATFATSATLSSCATFNRNDVAARVGDDELTVKQAQQRIAASAGAAGANDDVTDGAQLRSELTSWIKADVLALTMTRPGFDDQVRAQYEQGLNGSRAVCLAAIPVATLDGTVAIMTALQSGTSFADAARQFSGDPGLAAAGGVVTAPDGTECMAPDALAPAVADVLATTPVGQPLAADLDTFAAVLLLRPYDDLSDESRATVAAATIGEGQLAELYANAGIYVDPRYGRWDSLTQSVQPLRT